MENPSDPEKSSPEYFEPTYVRPPGLEFTMGVALFALIFMIFFMVQSLVFLIGVVDRSPEFSSFSLDMMNDPAFQARMQEFIFNGDLVALEAIWSGAIGVVLILLSVFLWKRRNSAVFLGLHLPKPIQFLKWIGIFLVLSVMVEVLTRYSTAFESEFMAKILESATDPILLFLGIAVMAPLVEEFLLRGLLFGSIRYIADEHVTVALTAGVFTLMHLQYNWTILLLILPMGVVLGYARSRSGSIWVPVLIHILNNGASLLLPFSLS